jgi:hypothetical protein
MERLSVRHRTVTLFLLAALALRATPAASGEDAPATSQDEKDRKIDKVYAFVQMFKFETLWYLHYRYGRKAEDAGSPAPGYETYNAFNISRGYLTMKVTPLSWFGGRITLDAHQDDEGDMKVRLKYLYGQFTVPMETKVLTEPNLEFGLVHMPWLDFEEHVNRYRAQGTMLMERSSLFNSADFGVTVGALLGPKLGEAYQKSVSGKYPGAWGSLALGLYNGGGYHAFEKNAAKAFEGRVTLRPAGPYFPYLQLSYFGLIGKGNMEKTDDWNAPAWWQHAVMLSFEHRYFVVTGQFVLGKGNQKGTFLDWETEIDPVTDEEVITGIAKVHEHMGASGFLEIKLPWILSSVIGRYDWFRKEDVDTQRIIAGWAFHFFGFHKNFLMLDVDCVMPDKNIEGAENTWEFKLTLQVEL